MATTFEDWQSAYPALANLNFGKNSLTGGTDLFSGFNGLGRPTGMADLPQTAQTGFVGGAPAQGNPSMLGFNMPTLQMGISGLQTLGGLYNAFQGNRLARDQLNFTRDFANTNMNNSIKTYNTQLEGRARARAVMEGQSDADRDRYIAENRLSR